MTSWKSKNAIVCGGSSGLGLCLARELVRQQAKLVVILGRDASRLNAARSQLIELASEVGSPTIVEIVAADLVNSESARQCSIAIQQLAPDIDLVLQCVGLSDRGSLAQLTEQRLRELLDANVVTSLHAIQSFSSLLTQRRGTIVLIGSLASLFAPRFLGGYSIAKHALAAMAQQARLELADEGIHVVLCCPGPIDRPDAGTRYQDRVDKEKLPDNALGPGGGAKVNRLDPVELSKQILKAAQRRRALLVLPRKAWWLRLITAFSQRLGDYLLRSKSS
jgi:NAD(P)-dependent dehydrogenase (short-subunit alcohol dehydrogenase family)